MIWEALLIVYKPETNHKTEKWNPNRHQTEILMWCNVFDPYKHTICLCKKPKPNNFLPRKIHLYYCVIVFHIYSSQTQFSVVLETVNSAKALLDFLKSPEHLSWGHNSAWGTAFVLQHSVNRKMGFPTTEYNFLFKLYLISCFQWVLAPVLCSCRKSS